MSVLVFRRVLGGGLPPWSGRNWLSLFVGERSTSIRQHKIPRLFGVRVYYLPPTNISCCAVPSKNAKRQPILLGIIEWRYHGEGGGCLLGVRLVGVQM